MGRAFAELLVSHRLAVGARVSYPERGMRQPAHLLMALNERRRIVRLQVGRAPRESAPSRFDSAQASTYCFERYVFVNERTPIVTALDLIARVGGQLVVEPVGFQWGLIFSAADRTPILSLYLDDAGAWGAIQGHAAALHATALVRYLHATYGARIPR